MGLWEQEGWILTRGIAGMEATVLVNGLKRLNELSWERLSRERTQRAHTETIEERYGQ
jgi:hypothetical protein